MNQTIVSYLAQYEFFDHIAALFKGNESLLAFLVFLLVALIIVGLCATIGGLGTYAERKISADIQQRLGPNRVGPYGILQFLADGVKMMTKEDIMPFTADKMLFYLAPMLALVGVFATLAVLPFSSGFMMTNLNVGVFYLIAISSLVGLAVFLGGYASNSKWSMLGGMRGASQIISYEIPVTISILAITVLAGGMSFGTIVGMQKGLPINWFIFHNPFAFLAFFVFFTGALAETNRAPFDLPEAESELVSGYHTEYTGMRFGFFALAEYIEVFVVCGVAAALFLGGSNLPFTLEMDNIPLQLVEFSIFMSKTLLLYYVVIWIRWTFPRLRVDQLMSICWKYLTPIAIFNLMGCAIWLVVFNGKSMAELMFGGH
ncbi:MAG TPA: NADH-quinone oxidoreductase subunit NuoH [Bacteriovoracaceae bacterium]|nr:NADH-quinone oxidoreductase subunit NuoH [Bacteriovoracaceae bacterium]